MSFDLDLKPVAKTNETICIIEYKFLAMEIIKSYIEDIRTSMEIEDLLEKAISEEYKVRAPAKLKLEAHYDAIIWFKLGSINSVWLKILGRESFPECNVKSLIKKRLSGEL